MYASGGFYPYQIEQSLRFNDDDSAYLSRTPASAGNRKTWTWSGWIKRGNLGRQMLFCTPDSNYPSINIEFQNETFWVQDYDGSTNQIFLTSAAVLRDPSAWYHLVFALDTTQATASNRAEMYINGVKVTSFVNSTYPTQNYDGAMNRAVDTRLGAQANRASSFFDGYMAEVNFIDGTALDPTSFGEFKSGIWVPKAYSGSYGTNGFYLSFADSAAIGDDLSGNGNDWTANNLVATDVLLDSPTNNFAVLNAIGGGISETLSEGNLSVAPPGAGNTTATIGVTSGKWYWEGRVRSDNYYSVGITNEAGVAYADSMSVSGSNSVGYWSGGGIYDQGGLVATVASYGTADVVAAELDMDAGNIKFYKNNIRVYTYTFGSSGAGVTFPVAFAAVNSGGGSGRATDLNFGQDSSFAGNKTRQGNTDENGVGDFYYTPGEGYLALCTANLPDPVIDPAQDDVPADYFNTVLYTGTGSTINLNTVGFQPDLTWIKGRNFAFDHGLFDAVRGGTKQLYSNLTNAEYTWTSGITFDSEGVDISADSNLFNGSGYTYAAWNWLAGNGTSSNSDGTITSTVSVNQKAGFSIATFTDAGSACTIGHGLGVAPDVVIAKFRGTSGNWSIYHKSLGPTKRLIFTTSAELTSSGWWNNTAPTSTVFSLGSSLVASTTQVAYCFAEVEGYSKFGSYTGNGSTDGTFVYTGFRPKFLLVKGSTVTSTWRLVDTSRSTDNVANDSLAPNESSAELVNNTSIEWDLLSNGFKCRDTYVDLNQSGQTYIYMAFAESPFKYANAR